MKYKTNSIQTINCAWCGAQIQRYPSQITGTNTCSRKCQAQARSKKHNPNGYKKFIDTDGMSKNMTRINYKLNPTRMTPEVRAKLRKSQLGSGEGKSYEKTYGRHTHRVVMEEKLGRSLQPGEIVHHIDGNKRNNSPENLMVMTQSEHARLHYEQGDLRRKTL